MAREGPFKRDPRNRELGVPSSYISNAVGITVATAYKYLKDRYVGDIWYWLASIAHDTVPNYVEARLRGSKPTSHR